MDFHSFDNVLKQLYILVLLQEYIIRIENRVWFTAFNLPSNYSHDKMILGRKSNWNINGNILHQTNYCIFVLCRMYYHD